MKFSLNLISNKNKAVKKLTQNKKNHTYKVQIKKSRKANIKTKKMKTIYKI